MNEMKVNYDKFSKLPFPVRAFCFKHGGWLVGGAAKYLLDLDKDEPRDWDILIPLEHWDAACKSIPRDSRTNSFGGIKFTVDDVTVDVWGDSLSHYIETQNKWPGYAVNVNGFIGLAFYKGSTR